MQFIFSYSLWIFLVVIYLTHKYIISYLFLICVIILTFVFLISCFCIAIFTVAIFMKQYYETTTFRCQYGNISVSLSDCEFWLVFLEWGRLHIHLASSCGRPSEWRTSFRKMESHSERQVITLPDANHSYLCAPCGCHVVQSKDTQPFDYSFCNNGWPNIYQMP